MTEFSLIAQTGTGEQPVTPVPSLDVQTAFIKKLGIALITFEIRASPVKAFYPDFIATNPFDIAASQQDFLWENSCYELFIGFGIEPQNPYVEINFSPNGAFNLYHFDGYRTPKQIPPRRLRVSEKQRQQLLNFYYQSDSKGIFWQNSLSNHTLLKMIEAYQPLKKGTPSLVLIINIAMIADLLKVSVTDNLWFNPCAVFANGNNDLAYFTHQHTNPPDFHAKTTWLKPDIVAMEL